MMTILFSVPAIAIVLVGFSLLEFESGYNQEQISFKSELIDALQGIYDNVGQVTQDEDNNIPEKQRHYRVNRSFVKVNPLAMNTPVVVATTHYYLKQWSFDSEEFLVWVFEDGKGGKRVAMKPYHFKDISKYMAFSRDAEKLTGITLEDLQLGNDKDFKIIWEKIRVGEFKGISTVLRLHNKNADKMVAWVWKMHLKDDVLYIDVQGEADDGQQFELTPLGNPYRLQRLP